MSQNEQHKGYHIVIDDERTMATVSLAAGINKPIEHLQIANKRIAVSEIEPGKFFTDYLPYTTYDSILELAKAVIDYSADFDTLAA